MSPPTVYLVTGAGRGIGFSLVEELASRPNTIVFTSVRSLPLRSDDKLALLAAKHPNVVMPIKLTSADEADNQAAALFIQNKVGKVDVIIACAGTSTGRTTIAGATLAQVRSDFETNTVGPIVLYQAFNTLLALSDAAGGAKFVIISSVLGQITEASDYSYDAYGISKAAVNFVAKKLSQEVPDLISFPMHPGAVDTDMGRYGTKQLGLDIMDIGGITPQASATGILNVVDASTKDTHSGKFWSYTGDEMTY